MNCNPVHFSSYQILTDAALLKRQKKEIEELRAKLQVSLFLLIVILVELSYKGIFRCV